MTLVMVLVYAVVQRLPLPGLDLEALQRWADAQGVTPLGRAGTGVTVLVEWSVIVAAVMMVVPRWREFRARGDRWPGVARTVVWLGTAATVIQGIAIASGYQAMMVGAASVVLWPGPLFRVVCVATMLGVFAVSVGLARGLRDHTLGEPLVWMVVGPRFVEAAVATAQGIARGAEARSTLEALLPCLVGAMLAEAALRTHGDTPVQRWHVPVAGLWPAGVAATFWGAGWLGGASAFAVLVVATVLLAAPLQEPLASTGSAGGRWPSLLRARVPVLVASVVMGVAFVAADVWPGLGAAGLTAVAGAVGWAFARDVIAEGRFRRRHANVSLLWAVDHVPASVDAQARLQVAGIPYVARSGRLRAMMPFGANYAPVVLIVPISRVDEARALLVRSVGSDATADPG